MSNWEFIAAIVGFAILPVVLVVKSWRKTRKTSWEWVCFALWPMSTYIAFGQFWILPTLAEIIRSFSLPDGITSFLISGTQVMTIFVGPFLYFMLWDTVEEPTITEPRQWRLFRSFTAVIALILFFLPGVTEIAGIQPPALMQNVVIICYVATLIAFVFAQTKIVGDRVLDAARIVGDTSQHISNENKEVRKGSLQRLGKVAEHSPAAQDLIIGFLEDENDEILLLALTYVKRFSVRAASAVPTLATLMAKDKPPNSREGIHDLLVEITGTDQGPDAEKWVSWAEENSAQLVPRRQENFAIKYSKLDEKMIEQISMMYKSKSTPELQGFFATANKTEYIPETFEAIRRLIELRKENSLKRIRANLKDGEEVDKIYQKEKEKESQDHLKNSLEEIEQETTHHSAAICDNNVRKTSEYPSGVETKKCPKCAEEIKLEALVCRYCGQQFDETEVIQSKELIEKEENLKKKVSFFEKQKQSFGSCDTWGKWLSVIGALLIFIVFTTFVLKSDFNILSALIGALIACPFLIIGKVLTKKANKIEVKLTVLREELREEGLTINFRE